MAYILVGIAGKFRKLYLLIQKKTSGCFFTATASKPLCTFTIGKSTQITHINTNFLYVATHFCLYQPCDW